MVLKSALLGALARLPSHFRASAPTPPASSLPQPEPVTLAEAAPVGAPSEVAVMAAPARSVHRRAIPNDVAIARFVAWMRDWGFSGWHTAEYVGLFYEWFCKDQWLEEMHHDLLRELVAAAPGVTRDRRRIAAASEPDLVRIRRRLKGVDRVMLYRVSSHEEMAEREAAKVAAGKARRQPSPATVSRSKTTPEIVARAQTRAVQAVATGPAPISRAKLRRAA